MRIKLHQPTLLFLLALLLALSSTASTVYAQDERATTQERIDELKKLLAEDEDRLSQTQRQERASEKQLADIDRQISVREELVKGYERRRVEMEAEKDTLEKSLALLAGDIDRLKTEYQARATHAYKYGRLHDLALVFAAKSINEMMVRVRYLKRFSSERKTRLTRIQTVSTELDTRRINIEETAVEIDSVLVETKNEQSRLANLRTERQRIVRKLRADRQSLQSSIDERRSVVKQLEARIRQLIAAESASSAPSAASRALTGSFEQNRGKFGWPTLGVVRETFGDNVHPVHGTVTNNPGILIASSPQAEVHSIFEGRVISVDIMPEFGNYIVIEHGDYHTVFGNFSLLYVGEDQQVSSGQLIGRAGTDSSPKGPGIFFAIFQKGEPINPVPWLGKP